MNTVRLASRSTVAAVTPGEWSNRYILRCFACTWCKSLPLNATWGDALNLGIEHEATHEASLEARQIAVEALQGIPTRNQRVLDAIKAGEEVR